MSVANKQLTEGNRTPGQAPATDEVNRLLAMTSCFEIVSKRWCDPPWRCLRNVKRIGYPILCGVSMLWLFLSTSLYAQERTLRFEHLSLEQGLSQSSVYAIVQDHKGFMWFGTEDGLNRYDGYRFWVYRNHADDPKSLSSSAIEALYEDRSGVL